jgi:hypothetical protein
MGFKDLFKPKYQHSDPKVRCSAVKELDDMAIIIDIAKNDKNQDVRIAAIERITDETILADIAKKTWDFETAKVAIDNIDNEDLLIGIGTNLGYDRDKNEDYALSKINENKLFDLYVLNQDHPGNTRKFRIRNRIKSHIQSDDLLYQIYLMESDIHNSKESTLNKINNSFIVDKYLSEDISNELSEYDSNRFLEKLNNDELIQIINNSKIEDNVIKCLKIIKDEKLIADYIIKHSYDEKCIDLLNYIGNEEIKRIIENIDNEDFILQCRVKLGEGYVCKSCGKFNEINDDSPCICKYCNSENHDYEFINNIKMYRDYEMGYSVYRCRRCNKERDYRWVDTL